MTSTPTPAEPNEIVKLVRDRVNKLAEDGISFDNWPELLSLPDEVAAALHSRSERAEVLEEAATTALEQRCERGTPWDAACVAVAAAIRALITPIEGEK